MRIAPLIVGFFAAAFTQAAWAAPVALAPVMFAAEFQTTLDEEIGAREGDVLSGAVTRSVSTALVRHGATMSQTAPITVEVTILDAKPNRPTMLQIFNRPGLDPGQSISIGGAELHAVLRSSDGQVLGEVDHRRFNAGLGDVFGAQSTWTEARHAIRQFAEKVADAYVAHSAP
jgi:hypothetical protein